MRNSVNLYPVYVIYYNVLPIFAVGVFRFLVRDGNFLFSETGPEKAIAPTEVFSSRGDYYI